MRELIQVDSEAAVGMYQTAVRLFLIPMMLPDIVLKVFLPQFSRVHGRSGDGLMRDLKRVNHVLLTLGLLIGIVTVFRGGDLIRLFYGSGYDAAGPILQILGLSLAMRFGTAYNLYFTIRNRIWFRVFSALLALFAVVVLDWMLIPRYGALGAAYASVIAHVVYWIPYLLALFKEERTIALGWNATKAAGMGLLLVAFLAATANLHLAYMLPIYAMLCLLAAYASMQIEDRARVRTQFQLRGK
jgi:O-antigen/teichoic acid export membrane protein